MEVPTLGIAILDGATRVSTPGGLLRLDELSGSGPQGPARPAGPAGPPGEDADTSQFYSKTQTNTLLSFKQNNIASTAGTGTELFNNGMMRRLVSGTNVTLTIDGNDNIIITAAGGVWRHTFYNCGIFKFSNNP